MDLLPRPKTKRDCGVSSPAGSCERHAVDPQHYLTSVLAKIGTTPREELDQFLPDIWKAEDAAEPTPEE